jgi:hypothetical protein
VPAGMRAFRSLEHLAQILNRSFGNKVERLILDFYGDSGARRGSFWGDDDDDDDDNYDEKKDGGNPRFVRNYFFVREFVILLTASYCDSLPVFDIKNYDDESTIFFTQDKKFHAVSKTVWRKYEWHSNYVARFLLIFYEIIEKNAKSLPHLKRISLDLNIQDMSQYTIRVDSVYKDRILSASLKDCDTEGDIEVVEGDDWEDEYYIDQNEPKYHSGAIITKISDVEIECTVNGYQHRWNGSR